jgi:hypothetical protein
VVAASNDGNTWTNLYSATGLAAGTSYMRYIQLYPRDTYQYYRYIARAIKSTNVGGYHSLYEFAVYGDSSTAWTPLNVSGLQNFYSADSGVTVVSGTITQWSDLSGNNRHATQATPANQPVLATTTVNGFPMINFGNVAGKVMTATGYTGIAFTFATVLYLSLSTSFNTFLGTAGTYLANSVHNQFSPNTRNMQLDVSGAAAAYAPGYAFTDLTPFLVVLTGSISGTSVTRIAYVNGTAYTTNTQTVSTITTFNWSSFNIGGWDQDTARTLNGGMSALAMYNTVLSTADRQKLEGYMAWKWWGSGSILPSTHPYRNERPTTTISPTSITSSPGSVNASFGPVTNVPGSTNVAGTWRGYNFGTITLPANYRDSTMSWTIVVNGTLSGGYFAAGTHFGNISLTDGGSLTTSVDTSSSATDGANTYTNWTRTITPSPAVGFTAGQTLTVALAQYIEYWTTISVNITVSWT